MSEHFSEDEMRCKCGCGQVIISSTLSIAQEKLRKADGSVPHIVNSAYRCPKWNKKIGGALHSRHPKGEASDLRSLGMSPRSIALMAETVPEIDGIGLYVSIGRQGRLVQLFCHIDVNRTNKARWGCILYPPSAENPKGRKEFVNYHELSRRLWKECVE